MLIKIFLVSLAVRITLMEEEEEDVYSGTQITDIANQIPRKAEA